MPLQEELKTNPISPYAVSKLAAENYVKIYQKVYGLATVCLRYFNVYGSRQIYSPYSGVITTFINRLHRNEPLVVFGDGEQTRDFVHVRDVVEANVLALSKKTAVGEIFNIATGRPTTVNRLAEMVQRIMKTNLRPVHASSRSGDIKHNYADITRARRLLQYEPKISLVRGLTQLVKWYTDPSKSMS